MNRGKVHERSVPAVWISRSLLMVGISIIMVFSLAYAGQESSSKAANQSFSGRIADVVIVDQELGGAYGKETIAPILSEAPARHVELRLTEHADKRFRMTLAEAVQYGLVEQMPIQGSKFVSHYKVVARIGLPIEVLCERCIFLIHIPRI